MPGLLVSTDTGSLRLPAACFGRRATALSAVAFGIGLVTRLLDTMRQYRLRVPGRSAIRKQLLQLYVVVAQSHEDIPDIRPRLDVVPLRPGHDRVHNGRSRSCILAAQK